MPKLTIEETFVQEEEEEEEQIPKKIIQGGLGSNTAKI